MLLCVFVLLFVNITLTWGGSLLQAGITRSERIILPENYYQVPAVHSEELKEHGSQIIPVINLSGDISTKSNITINTSISNATSATSNSTNAENTFHNQSKLNERVQSGALLRGFFVVLGITVLLLIYLGVRMFRLGKSNKPPTMVRKYGILTNRADVEMLPLPLSEDEDDDTVFELNNHIDR